MPFCWRINGVRGKLQYMKFSECRPIDKNRKDMRFEVINDVIYVGKTNEVLYGYNGYLVKSLVSDNAVVQVNEQ